MNDPQLLKKKKKQLMGIKKKVLQGLYNIYIIKMETFKIRVGKCLDICVCE